MGYEDDPRFSSHYLEGSWVLGLDVGENRIVFDLDAVLTPEHPEYRPAEPGEQHCYLRSKLIFEGVADLDYRASGRPPAHDASDEPDYGHIDAMNVEGQDRFTLEGDWGELSFTAGSARIVALAAELEN
ncbi:hypothetical protein P1X14_01305 [Sphingomonas sp. AOB5]|uniref:hypothetical protein n=1 Tax=Sphingomonas sp. AOB5 TaxID=3034017 RepID=UPI0023F9554E|nr:hypothetical protein [Sphingomonas sp. AOB5]MDF7773868.1 hypothetical protein [Sphingomonas sp. AOB5]